MTSVKETQDIYRIVGGAAANPLEWHLIVKNVPGAVDILTSAGFNIMAYLDLTRQLMPHEKARLRRANVENGIRSGQSVPISHVATDRVYSYGQLDVNTSGFILRIETALLELANQKPEILNDSSYLANRHLAFPIEYYIDTTPEDVDMFELGYLELIKSFGIEQK